MASLSSRKGAVSASRTQSHTFSPKHHTFSIHRPFATSLLVSRNRSAKAGAAISAAALPKSAEAVVVGGGLAGLACAVSLRRRGVDAILIEAADDIGGRTRTDVVDGFLLDRGFQIFLTAYPEAKQQLDFEALDLQPFYAGALVWHDGKFHRVADPLRHFTDGLQSLPNPIGSVQDKVLVGLFRLKCLLGTVDDILAAPETTTLECLKAEGFSDEMIDRFFRPFLGGIFFDNSLSVSSRLFRYVMRMLATGQNCLPATGIQAMAKQLEAQLPAGAIYTGTRVAEVVGSSSHDVPYVVAGGSKVEAERGVVVAVDGPQAAVLLGEALQVSPSKPAPGVGTCNLYFKAPKPPSPENILYLDGTGKGIVNNACFPSTVAPSYAPAGQALVSVSTTSTLDHLSDAELEATVRQELSVWFGAGEVDTWTHLKTYRIPFAQPSQSPPTNFTRPVALGSGLFVCGDHRDSATFDAALKSGRRAAEALLATTTAQKKVAGVASVAS